MSKKWGKIAVLIDGDSSKTKYLERIMSKAGQCGDVLIRRIYCDPNKLKGYEECMKFHKFDQKDATGQNYADFALAMDAAALRDSKKVDSFFIVAGDNDFAGVAKWLKCRGGRVMGIVDPDKSNAFKNECDEFVCFEELPTPADPDPVVQEGIQNCRLEVVKAIEAKADGGGYARLSDIGQLSNIGRVQINSKKHGHRKLKSLIESHKDKFEISDEKVRVRVQRK